MNNTALVLTAPFHKPRNGQPFTLSEYEKAANQCHVEAADVEILWQLEYNRLTTKEKKNHDLVYSI